MALVTFLPSATEVEVSPDETLFAAAQAAGVPIATLCGGLGNCGSCKVRVVSGDEHLSPMGPVEKSRLGTMFFLTKERLACQTRVEGPVVVEVLLEQARDKSGRARKRALDRTLENAERRAQRTREAQAPEPRRPADPPPRPEASPAGPASPASPNGSPRRRRRHTQG